MNNGNSITLNGCFSINLCQLIEYNYNIIHILCDLLGIYTVRLMATVTRDFRHWSPVNKNTIYDYFFFVFHVSLANANNQ